MKKITIIAALLLAGFAFAQESKPFLEKEGEMVKATYYYENGKIKQVGFFKEGKLNGQWVSYDEKGNQSAIGEYTNGDKTGKWFFWNGKSLSEVDYSKNKIETITSWKQEALVNRN